MENRIIETDMDGVNLKKLDFYSDDRGCFGEVLKLNDSLLEEIQQVNLTKSYPGVIKAFHIHKKQNEAWFVIKGNIQAVLHDLRKDSETYKQTKVFYMGETNMALLTIPAGVAHGYRVLGTEPVTLLYMMTNEYDKDNPDEGRISPYDESIGFDWTTKNR